MVFLSHQSVLMNEVINAWAMLRALTLLRIAINDLNSLWINTRNRFCAPVTSTFAIKHWRRMQRRIHFWRCIERWTHSGEKAVKNLNLKDCHPEPISYFANAMFFIFECSFSCRPARSSEKVAEWKTGTEVYVFSHSKGWYEIEYDGIHRL